MFCNQCEQTVCGKGCTVMGVCGKTPEVAILQDLLVYVLKGLSRVAIQARNKGNFTTHEIDVFVAKALFDTLTNVNFDELFIIAKINEAVKLRDELKAKMRDTVCKNCGISNYEPMAFMPADSREKVLEQGKRHNMLINLDPNEDIRSLKQMLIYGIKGIAAYVDHAQILGQEDDVVYHFIQDALAMTLEMDVPMETWVDMLMECGQMNLRAMELLDAAHTKTFGHPVPTTIPLGYKKGKAILISGHDLKDLQLLLEQTKGRGINVYAHGEMLPAHGYPKLKAYEHFYGHYGTAWQNQHKEFEVFPGAILMTTNCIQKPKDSYMDRIFTAGEVAWPGVEHVENKDFSQVIDKALTADGFLEDKACGSVLGGFARNAVLGVADKIVGAVKSGKIRHFFLVAGCDGAKPGRNYYTELVEKIPQDCVVLTLACGKFRFFDKKLGDIDGIPRLLDIGQCNDAYSAIKIAVALAEAFGVGVNELPLSMILSWYEQKAVAILLTLLSLGIKNIKLGPSLPAFVSPNVLNYLVDKFAIAPISTPDEDLKKILG